MMKKEFYQDMPRRNRPSIGEMLKKKELDPEKQEAMRKGTFLEKHDFLAMIIAGASVFLPVILGFFAVLALLMWLIFGVWMS